MPREVIHRTEGRNVFGRDPAAYERGRPGHPERVYQVLRERCGLRPGTSVLEIGPGTGQATRRLLELGADPLVAVEPDPALAEFLVSAIDRRPQVLAAPLEEADVPTAAFDLAVAASSFHWVDAERGLATILRALRPGGWWAMWWTHFGDKARPDPFRDAIDPVVGALAASPGARGFARDVESGLTALADAGFESCEHEFVRWSHVWDADGIRALFATFSPIARLDAPERDAILDEVARVAADEFGGRVEKPVLTSLYTARRPG
jgi:SAM-dependent methyltransferase